MGAHNYRAVKLRSTQGLLDADAGGFVNITPTQIPLSADPLMAHLNARKQVQPTDRSAKRGYTARAYIPDDAAQMRILHLPAAQFSQVTSGAALQPLPFKTQAFGVRTNQIKEPLKTFAHGKTPALIITPVLQQKSNTSAPAIIARAPMPIIKTAPKTLTHTPPKPHKKPLFNAQILSAAPAPSTMQATMPLLKPQRDATTTTPSLTSNAAVQNVSAVNHVLNIRKGDHPGYTRIVLDLNKQHAVQPHLSANQKTLTLNLPNAYWAASLNKTYPASERLLSYAARNTDDDMGASLTLNFANPVHVENITHLPATNGKSPRLVIDVSDT